MRVLVAVLALVAWFAPAPSAAAEGDSIHFRLHEMSFRGTRTGRAFADLDGDGLVDFCMALSSGGDEPVHQLRCCRYDGDRGFAGHCPGVRLPANARAWDLGVVDASPAAALVVLTDEGLRVARYRDAEWGFHAFGPLLPLETLLADTEAADPARLRFLWDLSGDGRAELVMPAPGGPEIHRLGAEGLVLLQRLESPARVSYRVGDPMLPGMQRAVGATVPQLVASRTAPTVFVGDFDGDGRADLATRTERVLRLFRQEADGRFEGAPSRIVERTSLSAEEASDPLADETPLLTDLDGDGLADLILLKWGSPEQRTRIDRRVFFARPGLVYPEEADQIVRSEGPIPDFVAEDLDRNGGRDLVVPFIHLAPAQAVKIIAENAIKVQLRFFLMGETGRYGQDPGKAFARVDRRVGIDYRVDLMSLISDDRRPSGRLNPLITVAPDVNGDGYPDLVADTGADRLAFYWGNAEVAFSRRPDHVVPLESALDYDLLDVNGDGRTDIVTYYSREVRTLREAASAERTQSLSAGRERPVPGPHEGGPAVKVLVTR